MKTVNLKINERIAISMALKFLSPGGYAKFQTAKNILTKVELSAAELDHYEVNDNPEGTTTWNAKKDTGSDIEFADREIQVICEGLNNMDERKLLSWNFITLYEIFIPLGKEIEKANKDKSKKSENE